MVGKVFDPKKGNCAWYVQEFYQWAENNRTPVRIVYFPETEKAKDAHIAILIDDLVLDFDDIPLPVGHAELVYDFRDGGAADGWLHGLFRYEDRTSGHVAESSFGAHIFNTAMT